MPPIRGLEILLAIPIALGVAGCLAALAGLRQRVRRTTLAGLILAALGWGLFELAAWGVIPAATLHRAASLFEKRPELGGLISWETEQDLLARAELGALPVEDFTALLGAGTRNRSIGSRGGSCVVEVASRVRAGRLPAPYADEFARWLIVNWPSWSTAGNEVDDIPGALFASAALSPGARARFTEFMVAQHADTTVTLPLGWTDALDDEALLGRMQRPTLEKYLSAMTTLALALDQPQPAAGDVLRCAATGERTHNDNRYAGLLPWHGRLTLTAGAPAIRSRVRPFVRFRWSDTDDTLAHVRVPAEPGEHELLAEAVIELTQDDLRAWFASNPHLRPPGFKAESWRDIRVVRQLKTPYRVVASDRAPPRRVSDAQTAAAVKASLSIDRPTVGMGRTAGGSIRVTADRPPVSLAMDVILVVDGREIVLDWFFAPEGVASHHTCTGRVGPWRRGPAKVLLRPSLTLIDRPVGATAVYDGEPIEFKSDHFHIHGGLVW